MSLEQDQHPPRLSPPEVLQKVVSATQSALQALGKTVDLTLVASWAEHVATHGGRVVLCGMGKSGLVAQKIAATLASTGCPSFFLHPAEALHGDLGMVTRDDSMVILSNSGESQEILSLLPSLLRLGIKIAAITSRRESRLGQTATWCFTYELPEGEGCPLNFAPMASTTIQMVWGDMLAAHLMVHSGFTLDKFAQFHPAGNIGARLLKSKELMHREIPTVHQASSLFDVLSMMTQGRLGMAAVMEQNRVAGVISDGDIRRAVGNAQAGGRNPLDLKAADIMTRNPASVPPDLLAVEAAAIMETRKITFLLIEDQGDLKGVLHIHDLLTAKVI